MSRWVVPVHHGLVGESVAGPSDDARARIVKYVPAEVLAVFTILFTGLASGQVPPEHRPWAAAGLIVLFLLVTVITIATQTPNGVSRKAHLLVSPLAFLAWAYPISSSALGDWFFPIAAFAAQAIVLALSVFIQPAQGQ